MCRILDSGASAIRLAQLSNISGQSGRRISEMLPQTLQLLQNVLIERVLLRVEASQIIMLGRLRGADDYEGVMLCSESIEIKVRGGCAWFFPVIQQPRSNMTIYWRVVRPQSCRAISILAFRTNADNVASKICF